jgi:hypothetical protein
MLPWEPWCDWLLLLLLLLGWSKVHARAPKRLLRSSVAGGVERVLHVGRRRHLLLLQLPLPLLLLEGGLLCCSSCGSCCLVGLQKESHKGHSGWHRTRSQLCRTLRSWGRVLHQNMLECLCMEKGVLLSLC